MKEGVRLGKIALLFFACLLFSYSVYYTDTIVKRIDKEERQKVLLWAHAIRKKAALITYTEHLFDEIGEDEKRKGQLWAKGVKRLISINNPNFDLSFVFEVVKNNQTVPVILTDEKGTIISSRNLDPEREKDKKYLEEQLTEMAKHHEPIEIRIFNRTKNYLYYKESRIFSELRQVLNDLIRTFITEEIINSTSLPVIYTDSTRTNILEYGNIQFQSSDKQLELKNLLEEMKSEHLPMRVDLPNGRVNYIFYRESLLLSQLKYYPYVQLLTILIFFTLAYILFNTSRLSEQNRVWVGMSKETAHQLGTPISSLMAWIEYIKSRYPDEICVPEMNKDIDRLVIITERFSKIGSEPSLKPENLFDTLEESIEYLKNRVSKKVVFKIEEFEGARAVNVNINRPLFEWAIENLTRNAVDAMTGDGVLTYSLVDNGEKIYLDITDSGKGIPSKNFKTVFKPGYSTKKRGWGLGLALVKRIILDYHQGKIYVKSSEIDVGTTFRISLKKH